VAGERWLRAGSETRRWECHQVICINVGISMLMAANLKAEFVWRTFMKAGEIAAAMKSVGLNPAAENPSVPQSGGGMHKMLTL